MFYIKHYDMENLETKLEQIGIKKKRSVLFLKPRETVSQLRIGSLEKSPRKMRSYHVIYLDDQQTEQLQFITASSQRI